jgi:hypothetical protein
LIKKSLIFALLIGLPMAFPEIAVQARTDTGELDRVECVEPAQSPSTPATLVVRGTIKNYDLASRILLLSTSSGTMQFSIPSGVRIRQRWHSIEASALSKYSGFHAAVRYSQSGALKTVQSVHVFGKDETPQ